MLPEEHAKLRKGKDVHIKRKRPAAAGISPRGWLSPWSSWRPAAAGISPRREAGSASGQAGGRRLAYPRESASGWLSPSSWRPAAPEPAYPREARGWLSPSSWRPAYPRERREAGSACQAGGGGPRGPPGGGPRGPPGVDGGGPLGSNNSVDAGDARWPSGPGKPPGVMGCKPGGGAPEDGPPPGPCCCCCCCATSIAMILIM